jgi:hypothetical protein
MNLDMASAGDADQFGVLNGIPQVDFSLNLQAAVSAGRRMTSILGDVIALRRGPGKLTPNEYFWYRLWDPCLTREEQLRFVGKQAQQPMHIACNDTGWYAAAADKLLFHMVMAGARMPVPDILAIIHPTRWMPGATTLRDETATAEFLQDPTLYPLFAKPVDGKYSLSVVSADSYDPGADRVLLLDGTTMPPAELASRLAGRAAGYVLQRRLAPDPRLARLFGPRLWSVRVLILMTPAGPVVHRAVAKIATGDNPADNFWRPGNILGAIRLSDGIINRTVRGTATGMAVNIEHLDTGCPIIGTPIPGWCDLGGLVLDAAQLLPAIRTQSWDIALSDAGPMPLEVNFGGDLNLAQLAHGTGVLDGVYRCHLESRGYRL